MMPGGSPALRVAVDVGGTFTDVAVFDQATGRIRLGKTLTTPANLVAGIASGVERAEASFAEASLFLHGTTVAINTMLERTGANTALVTTKGFRDVYEIARINRPDAYNLFFRKAEPLVPRALRFEVGERMSAAGEVLSPLDERELEAIAQAIERADVAAVAVAFLHCYRNPAHEIAAKRFFEARLKDCFVTTSHELSLEYREYERTSTAAANAYVGPKVKTYLDGLDNRLREEKFAGRFYIVQSSGGLYDSSQARRECIRMLESGPAAGVIGAAALCRMLGLADAIPFDMGGTTAKAGVIRAGVPLMASSAMIGGYNAGLPIQIPMIDIREVGTGGGSIARLAAGNSLRVGPQSAGADPGPACYGLGGAEPTVTDANLILGRLAADRFLDGDLNLDEKAARTAMRKLADPLAMTVEEAAEGVVQIASTTMSHVVTQITVERGLDARDFVLIAFGGAGPLHAGVAARELHIGRVIVPQAPGHFSACGMLTTDLRRDFVRTVFAKLSLAPLSEFAAILDALARQGREEIRAASSSPLDISASFGADMRYVGQEHAVTVDLPQDAFSRDDAAAVKAAFDARHTELYGFASAKDDAEIVSLRCAVVGALPKPDHGRLDRGDAEPPASAFLGERPVFFGGAYRPTKTFVRSQLRAGNRIEGPAIVEEHGSTTVVLPGDRLEVDDFGNLIIEITL